MLESNRENFGIKGFWRYALIILVPAFIAGVFSFSPKLYDILTAPTAQLSYEIKSGPPIELSGIKNTIYSISIENSGRSVLTDVAVVVGGEGLEIESTALTSSVGLSISQTSVGGMLSFVAPRMHRGDKFEIAALVTSVTDTADLPVSVRSLEALGASATGDVQGGSNDLTPVLISSALAALSVAAMSSLLIASKGGIVRKLTRAGLDRYETLSIAARLSGVEKLVEFIECHGDDCTYAMFSDVALVLGQGQEDAVEYCRSLYVLLLNRRINSESVVRIVTAICELGWEVSDENLKLVRAHGAQFEDATHLRSEMIRLFHQLGEDSHTAIWVN